MGTYTKGGTFALLAPTSQAIIGRVIFDSRVQGWLKGVDPAPGSNKRTRRPLTRIELGTKILGFVTEGITAAVDLGISEDEASAAYYDAAKVMCAVFDLDSDQVLGSSALVSAISHSSEYNDGARRHMS